MAAHARGEDPGQTDDEMDAYLAAPTPLAYWRKRRDLTQAKLAAAARISQPYLAQLESSRRASADIAVYARLAERIGVPIEQLIVETEVYDENPLSWPARQRYHHRRRDQGRHARHV
jgi:transcriptional regulator with XRE-family HTH domain